MTNRFSRFAMIGAALASFSASAQAQDTDQFRVSIAVADLNLANSAGQAALADRIDAAADRVCGYSGTVSLRGMMQAHACREAFARSASDQAKRLAAMNGRGSSFAAASR